MNAELSKQWETLATKENNTLEAKRKTRESCLAAYLQRKVTATMRKIIRKANVSQYTRIIPHIEVRENGKICVVYYATNSRFDMRDCTPSEYFHYCTPIYCDNPHWLKNKKAYVRKNVLYVNCRIWANFRKRSVNLSVDIGEFAERNQIRKA